MFRTGLASSSSGLWRAARGQCSKWLSTVAVVAGILVGAVVASPVLAKDSSGSNVPIPLASLPKQAQDTHRLILSGGPFPYPKDGVVFGNRERQLPGKARGFYHEYTVTTPGSRNRGAKRIVCGGEPKTQPEVCYYTDDHYATFSRIAP